MLKCWSICNHNHWLMNFFAKSSVQFCTGITLSEGMQTKMQLYNSILHDVFTTIFISVFFSLLIFTNIFIFIINVLIIKLMKNIMVLQKEKKFVYFIKNNFAINKQIIIIQSRRAFFFCWTFIFVVPMFYPFVEQNDLTWLIH
jgi:hypothetical protein